MLSWFNRLPAPIKGCGALAGAAVSAFSGRLPEAAQDIGLWLGIGLFLFFIAGLLVHGIKELRGGKQVNPLDVMLASLVGITVFALIGIGGIVWHLRASPSLETSKAAVGIVEQADPVLVKNIQLNTKAPYDNNTVMIMVTFEIATSSDRLRVFLDYTSPAGGLDDTSTAYGAIHRVLLEAIKDPFEGKRRQHYT